jgi:hypothetical protein
MIMLDNCINHPERQARDNLDGDSLCQECCEAWVKVEGDWQRHIEEESKDVP